MFKSSLTASIVTLSLLSTSLLSHAATSAVTVIALPNGSTVLSPLGAANYVVHVDESVTPSNYALNFTAQIPEWATQVTSGVSACNGISICTNPFSLSAGQRCCLMLSLDGSQLSAGSYSLAPQAITIPSTYNGYAAAQDFTVTGGGGTAVLSTSNTDLALSVTGLTLNGSASGQPRTITIMNTGGADATNVSVAFPTWPTGTNATSNCQGATLAANGGQCVITVSPGASATSDCSTTGIAPTPGVITVSADGTAPVASNVVVLNYGCIYQGGYVFAMTETANTTQSIGGTVVAQVDQAPRFPNGIIWSSNGTAGASNYSYDIIPGIAETSTSVSSAPTYAAAQTSFNTTYLNASTYPFPLQASFQACNGRTDGQCNSNNIAVLYNAYKTGYGVGGLPYTLSPGPTDLTYYAAGLCKATIASHSDWYLPAICEMGPASSGSGCSNTQNIVDDVPSLLGDPNTTPGTSCTYGANCLAGYYWSSTEPSGGPQSLAWYEYFSSGGSVQLLGDKDNRLGVRCSRALTL